MLVVPSLQVRFWVIAQVSSCICHFLHIFRSYLSVLPAYSSNISFIESFIGLMTRYLWLLTFSRETTLTSSMCAGLLIITPPVSDVDMPFLHAHALGLF